MISYLILSLILLTVGGLIYFLLLRNKLAAKQAKLSIFFIIILSLTLPFFTPELPNYSRMLSEGKIFYENYTQWNVVDITDKTLLDCCNRANDSRSMCDCEIMQKANLVTFHYDPVYNFLLDYGYYIYVFLFLISLVFIFELILKICFLVYVARTSYSIKQNLDGVKVKILYHNLNYQMPLSAFSLWNDYIIWSPVLDNLSENEKEAVYAHELSHLRNKDTWGQIIIHALKVLWWSLPVYYLFKSEIARLNEYIADEAASNKMGNKKSYARLLLKIKESQIFGKRTLLQTLTQSLLKNRVLRLINGKINKPADNLRFSAYIFFVFCILSVTAFFTLPEIQKQNLKAMQYELLHSEDSKTGEPEFCKSCDSQQR
jgi:hypothetical protein